MVFATGIGSPFTDREMEIIFILIIIVPLAIIGYTYHVFTEDEDNSNNEELQQEEDIDSSQTLKNNFSSALFYVFLLAFIAIGLVLLLKWQL